MTIPPSHPRYQSLQTRQRLEEGVALGITSLGGLIAQGRGEAFDYLLGEQTHPFAHQAIEAASSMLRSAKHPVISVNGNTAVLVPEEIVTLSQLLHCSIEVNLFHESKDRERKIQQHLMKLGGKNVLLPGDAIVPNLDSNRKFVNEEGIYKADVVFVPLEDGDRTEALIKMGKKVITVDLNPMSRTARTATVTIVDNITRAIPLLIDSLKNLKSTNQEKSFKNEEVLKEAEVLLRKH